MSSIRPAARASAVRCRSSGDGVGSPDGWLWTRMIPAALSRTASRYSSPAHLEDQPIGDIARAADRPAARRPVGQKPATELEGGHQLRRARRSDTRQSGELQVRRPGESRQPVVRGKRILGQVDGRPPARPGAPDEGDQLGRRQPGRPAERVSCSLRSPARPQGTAGPEPLTEA